METQRGARERMGMRHGMHASPSVSGEVRDCAVTWRGEYGELRTPKMLKQCITLG